MSRIEDVKQEKKAARKERVPLGQHRMKLKTETRDGYVRRWINDKPGRLDDAVAGGYEFVTDPKVKVGEGQDASQTPGVGSAVSRIVGTHEDGSPLRAYLMEIPQNVYDEDQAAKAESVDERENALRRGQTDPGKSDPHQYVPSGTPIRIEQSTTSK